MVKNHIHKYMFAQLGGIEIVKENGRRKIIRNKGFSVFQCGSPGCSHYIPVGLALGRQSICWICEEKMTIKTPHLKMKKPHHIECGKKEFAKKRKLAELVPESIVDEFMKKIGGI